MKSMHSHLSFLWQARALAEVVGANNDDTMMTGKKTQNMQ
jgi:hypothetical protein